MMKWKAPLVAAMVICILATTVTAENASAPDLYPAEIQEHSEGDMHRLHKVYILSTAEDPANIPTADFERGGMRYTLLDMTRTDQMETDTREYTEAVTLDTPSKDMDKIMPLLPAAKDAATTDGYAGSLTLNPASIQVEAAGYGNSSRTVTATRSYPNLSDADTALVPKTTEDAGRTLELADVQWQDAGGVFNATATYTGTASSRYVTGYTVTASYTGMVSKTINDTVVYTAIFGGTPIEPDMPEPAPSGRNWHGLVLSGILLLALLVVVSAGYFSRKGKGRHVA